MTDSAPLPLSGIKVVEFTHMVMGPTVGLILGDLGADVIKVEPLKGDNTRRLKGSGAGYFPMYNRNKRSICVDLKSATGKDIVLGLIDEADVLIENFRPGAMDRLGFGYDAVSARNEKLIYCSEKGFLQGPYDHRTALDEVTQMMGGLAYMTGPPGKPLRAGASVIDVQGGMWGAMGVISALFQRSSTGKGQQVVSSLFENTVFLMGQHMAQKAVTGVAAGPMPTRVSAWAVYEIFETSDNEQVFVGVVSDTQWKVFCEAFELAEFAQDESLSANAGRVAQRDRIIPVIQACFARFTKAELMTRLDESGLPFAPISRPEDLFDDPHLNAGGGLLDITLTDGERAGEATKLPALPVEMDGARFAARRGVPRSGEHTREVLAEAGFDESQIAALMESQVVAGA